MREWCNYIMTFRLLAYHIVTGNLVTWAIMLQISVVFHRARKKTTMWFQLFISRFRLSKKLHSGGALCDCFFVETVTAQQRIYYFYRYFIRHHTCRASVYVQDFSSIWAAFVRLINCRRIGREIYWCFQPAEQILKCSGVIKKLSFVTFIALFYYCPSVPFPTDTVKRGQMLIKA